MLILVLEGLLVIAVLIVAIMATQLPPSVIFARITQRCYRKQKKPTSTFLGRMSLATRKIYLQLPFV